MARLNSETSVGLERNGFDPRPRVASVSRVRPTRQFLRNLERTSYNTQRLTCAKLVITEIPVLPQCASGYAVGFAHDQPFAERCKK